MTKMHVRHYCQTCCVISCYELFSKNLVKRQLTRIMLLVCYCGSAKVLLLQVDLSEGLKLHLTVIELPSCVISYKPSLNVQKPSSPPVVLPNKIGSAWRVLRQKILVQCHRFLQNGFYPHRKSVQRYDFDSLSYRKY